MSVLTAEQIEKARRDELGQMRGHYAADLFETIDALREERDRLKEIGKALAEGQVTLREQIATAERRAKQEEMFSLLVVAENSWNIQELVGHIRQRYSELKAELEKPVTPPHQPVFPL